MWQHLRFGLRVLRRYPTFACGAIAVMALGVGATTAVYSVLRGVLLTPLPYRDPGQLVVFRADSPGVPASPTLTSLEFAALRAQTELFESVAAAVRAEGNLTAADVVIPLNAAAVSENSSRHLVLRLCSDARSGALILTLGGRSTSAMRSGNAISTAIRRSWTR
jgi:hypothetical protein